LTSELSLVCNERHNEEVSFRIFAGSDETLFKIYTEATLFLENLVTVSVKRWQYCCDWQSINFRACAYTTADRTAQKAIF